MSKQIEKEINFDEIKIIFKEGKDSITLTINEINGSIGNGDMLKSVYDTNDDGKVDNAENSDKLNGQEDSYYLDYNNFINTPSIPNNLLDLTDTPTDYTGQAGKVLTVKTTEDGIEFIENQTTDEKVKINSSDSTSGYLADKIDNSTIVVDNFKIKVADNLFTLKTDFNNHVNDSTIHFTQDSISINHSQISDWDTQFDNDFNNRFNSKSTDDLTEGTTNLYFTNERAQDAVGNILINTDSIDLIYDDNNNQIKANVKVDNNTIEIDSTNQYIKVKDNVFASKSEFDDHVNNTSNPHNVTKDQIGLGNVDNVKQIPYSEKGVANGVATLDSNGLVPSSQLPSYVDDVLEYDSKNDFPATGESGKIYVAKDTNLTYRWSGSDYVEISPSLALGTTHSTAFYGDWGNEAYQHSQITSGNPHNVQASEVPTNTNNFDKILSSNEDNIQKALDKLDDHIHDDRYYTETEIDSLLNDKEDKNNKVISWQATPDDTHYPSEKLVKDSLDNKSDIGHNHDDRYYTESEVDNLLDNKADKVSGGTENNFVSLDANGNIKDSGSKASDFANASHTHSWNDISKTGSKLSDIEDVPSYTGNANKILTVKSDESGVEWEVLSTTDQLVKADSNDSTAGFLSEKVDNSTIEVDTTNHYLKVKDGVFADANHTHTKSDISDFNESDYVHTNGNETINGIKTFNDNIVIKGTGNYLLLQADSVNQSNSSKIIFDEGDGNYHFQIIYDGDDDGVASGRLRFTNKGTTNLMVIERTGEIGIGVDTPSEKLEINGRAKINGYYPTTKYVSIDTVPSSSPYEVTITHNLNDDSPFVQVYYNNHLIEPYDVEIIDANNVKITVDDTLAGESIKTVIIGEI